MDLPDFLTRTAYDEIRLTGHRIGLIDIVYCFNEGESPEMIVCRFPTLRLAHVYKVIAFYLENQAAVDEYVRAADAEMERQRATGHHLDLAKLRARMDAIRQGHDRPSEA